MNEVTPARARVLVVVVTHNGSKWLSQCLQSLSQQSYPNYDVIVVDNGSSTNPAPVVGQIIPTAEMLRTKKNVGFAAAANRALEASERARDASYFLFIHDDSSLEPDCLERLVDSAEATGAGIVGAKSVGWDNPHLLVEVGMQADQLGYPFTDLEAGEIDQGQHDSRREVLYVSSACILVDTEVIEKCGSWDAGYFLFGEDLDFCLRSRLSGFKVIVEPEAKLRHAAALSNQVRETTGARSNRFYSRRNRPRTIAKNVAAYRLLPVLALYTLVASAEIVVLSALRRFSEVSAYPRAFGSFLVSIPDVASRRRAVQKRHSVPHRRVRRFMVSDLHRMRVFLERRLREWERGTLRLSAQAVSLLSPAAIRRRLSTWIRRRSSLAGILITAGLVFGLRDVIFGPQVALGGLWPFPQDGNSLLGDYFSSWRNVGLGTPASAPPALPILWIASVLTGGRPRISQVFVVLVLLGIGLIGMSRFLRRRGSPLSARMTAVLVYGFGPLAAYLAGAGDLGGLAFFAGLPWLLEIGLRMLGPTPGLGGDRSATPPTSDSMSREMGRAALISAAVVALAPSAVIALAVLWIALGAALLASSWDREEVMRRAGWAAGSIVAALVVLVPWSLGALGPEGPIVGPLFAGSGGGPIFGPLWRTFDARDLFFATPGGQLWARIAVFGAVIGAVLLPSASRRREVRILGAAWLLFGLLGAMAATGVAPAPVASPGLWMVLPAAVIAISAGHLVSGVAEELPQHALGWRHIATPVILLSVLVGIVGSSGAWVGGWERGASTHAAEAGEVASSTISFFTSTADEVGDFRVLWIGDQWLDPVRPAAPRPRGLPYLLTGPQGLEIQDLFPPVPSDGLLRLEEVLDSLLAGQVHLSGHLLGPASVRYFVVGVQDAELMAALSRQRDVALRQQQAGIAIFENLHWLPRAVLAPGGLANASSKADPDDRTLMETDWVGGRALDEESRVRFVGRIPRTRRPILLLADEFHGGWKAQVSNRELKHSRAFGWANRFDLNETDTGRIEVRYTRWWSRLGGLAVQGLVLAIVLAVARGGAMDPSRGLR